jgi:hypothetical protein
MGLACCAPTPVTSTPGKDRKASVTVFAWMRASVVSFTTATGAGTEETGRGVRVAVTISASPRKTVSVASVSRRAFWASAPLVANWSSAIANRTVDDNSEALGPARRRCSFDSIGTPTSFFEFNTPLPATDARG